MFLEDNNTNFQAKGLGWVPDYPDARDYELGNDIYQKLGQATEQVTGQDYFEGINILFSQLVEKCNFLEKSNKDEPKKILEFLQKDLERFDFLKVKVYKVLRAGSEGREVIFLKYLLIWFYENELNQTNESKTQDEAVQAAKNELRKSNLGFLNDPEKRWIWLNEATFESDRTEVLVKAFQTWAKRRNKKYGSVDGIVGIETFSYLEHLILKSNLKPSRSTGGNDKIPIQEKADLEDLPDYLPIPFPASIPLIVLQAIFKKIFSYKNEEFSKENEEFSEEDDLRGSIEIISRKYFLFIEPIISVITHILGPVGAYRDVESAIELAVGKFLFLLKPELDSYLANIMNLSNLARISYVAKSYRFQLSQNLEEIITVLDLKFLGSSEKLPDHLLLELNEELCNLKYLRNLLKWAIYDCDDKFRQEFPEKQLNNEVAPIGKFLSRLKKLSKPSNQIPLIENFLSGLKESSKDEPKAEKQDLPSPTIIEFIPPLSLLSKIDKGSQTSSTNTDNRSTRFFLESQIPNGADLLENLKTLLIEDSGKKSNCSLKNWKDHWRDENFRVYTHLPVSIDLSFWCSPTSDQGGLKSCAAHAGAALIEYFSKRYLNDYKPVSTRFLYKIARNLADRKGDTGISLRETIKAMITFGIPPEAYWRSAESNFDEEPTSFCYSFAQNYQTLSYFRLDHPDVSKDELLTRIKIALAAGFPCMFGFTVHASIYNPFNVQQGHIPYPGKLSYDLAQPDEVIGGHAVVAVGYHDYKKIRRSNGRDYSTGALLIRNSWGSQWGLGGYGWLPYDYVVNGLTSDWWSLVKTEWLQTGKFGLGGTKDWGEVPQEQREPTEGKDSKK
jgi:C1A family cysteine protease